MASKSRTRQVQRKKVLLFSKEGRELVSDSKLVLSQYSPDTVRDPLQQHQHQQSPAPGPAGHASLSDHTYSTRDPECTSCHVTFSNREEQVEHYKLDWHRYNLKRKLKGLEGVGQDQFERISGDLSSISGSESDSDSDITTDHTHHTQDSPPDVKNHSPYLHFSPARSSDVYSVYRCVVGGASTPVESYGQNLRKLGEPQVWLILMRSGGHFAGAVFRGSVLEAHKTFHRYTVRAKRGTSQAVRDGQQGGHQPKSAGASLRRYNEAALMTEMRELMTSWSGYIDEASCIFIRTPKWSKGILVGDKGGKAPFVRGDPRLREIPFPTRRPTLKEVTSAHAQLACVYVGVAGGDFPHSPAGRGVGKGSESAGGSEMCGEVNVNTSVNADSNTDVNADLNTDVNADLNTSVSADTANMADADTSKTTTKSKQKKKGKKKGTESAIQEPKVEVPLFIQQLVSACEDDDVASPEDVVAVLKGAGLKDVGVALVSSDDVVETILERAGLGDSGAVLEGAGLEVKGSADMEGAEVKVKSSAADHSALEQLNKTWNGDTVLHTASINGCSSLIPILLQYGANPTVKNDSGHTPYLVARNKDVRDSFRRFMASSPEAYDYERAYIPSPLTTDMELERSRKEAEKRKEKKKVRKQKAKEKKVAKEMEACKSAQEQAALSLSDRERRAMAAEKRMVSSQSVPSSSIITRAGSCSGCGKALVGVVPFERLDFRYCSMECLKQHRKTLT